ncbi:MAG: hypothetical protein CM1200mP6_00750 [Anaerolineaceae bacterium]|nr:MAG: hypothetical protein CM1200mP6_00750 [Anaerolineaceae bacterium]
MDHYHRSCFGVFFVSRFTILELVVSNECLNGISPMTFSKECPPTPVARIKILGHVRVIVLLLSLLKLVVN